MSRLSISLLGTFQATLAEKPLSGFESDKARALLAYLAVESDRPHRREMLAGLLWPEFPERSARANLRTALANLRQTIGDRDASPPFLQVTRQTIQFNSQSDSVVDVDRFRSLLETGSGSQSHVIPLEEAAYLYRGPFLSGFSVPDSPPFEEWLIRKREECSRQIGAVLQNLSDLHEHQSAYEKALAHAQRWVDTDPCQELAHRQVMRLLVLNGQRSQALFQYETCRQILAEELEIEPEDETTHLYEQIRTGVFQGTGASVTDSTPKHNLPHSLFALIGRERELSELARLLSDSEVRLLTIVGPGGIGKTHLALEAAAAEVDHFAHGVYLISLVSLGERDSLVTAIADVLQLSLLPDSPHRQQLLDYLRQKQMLLVLDNFEHLLAEVDLIIAILQSAPALKILATSRAQLNVHGEQLYPLSGLSYPSDRDGTPIAATRNDGTPAAAALFEYSAKHLQPSFALTNDNYPDVVGICQLVWGMPLGILLASAWIELLAPGEIACEIRRNFGFLRAEWSQLPERHRSLESIFTQSWQLLRSREQMIFLQLSVFRGGFTAEAAQAVCGATLPDLLNLVHRCMIHRSADGRYATHELLRQFADQKLGEDPAGQTAVRERHSAFYVALLHARDADLRTERQQAAIVDIGIERDNIRTAWQWAVDQAAVDHLDRAADSLGAFYEWRGHFEEGEAAFCAAADRLSQSWSNEQIRVLSKMLLWQSTFNRLLGHAEPANRLVRCALHLLSTSRQTDRRTQLEEANLMLEVGQQSSNFADARRWLERSLKLYRTLGDDWGTARALCLLGHRLDTSGAVGEGRELLEESLQLRRRLEDRRGIAETLETLGFILMRRGQAGRGEQMLRQGMKIRHEIGDKAAAAHNLIALATGLIWHGRFADARTLLEENLRLCQDTGNRPRIVSAKNMLSVANLHLGRYEIARRYAEESLRLCRETDDARRESFALWSLGSVALAAGKYAEAEEHLQNSVVMHETLGMRNRLHDVRASLGYAAWGLGKVSRSRHHLMAVLQIALENRLQSMMLRAVSLAALLTIEKKNKGRAVELYALAKCYPYVGNSRWYEDVVGRCVGAVAAELPPAEVSNEQARGRTGDLWQTGAELLAELEILHGLDQDHS